MIYDVHYYVRQENRFGSVKQVIAEGLDRDELQQLVDRMAKGYVEHMVITAWPIEEEK